MGAVSLVACAVTMPASAGRAEDVAPDGAITRLPSVLPNYIVGTPGFGPSGVSLVQLFADPTAGTLFSVYVKPGHCPNIVAFDIDSLTKKNSGCISSDAELSVPNSPTPMVAVDSQDHLLFFPSQGAADGPPALLEIYSEDTYARLGSVTLHTEAMDEDSNIDGMSWDPVRHDILLMTSSAGGSASSSPPGVEIIKYHVQLGHDATGARTWGTEDWWVPVPLTTCADPLDTWYATQAPFAAASDDAVFFTCAISGNATLNNVRPGVVKMGLRKGASSIAGAACNVALCPQTLAASVAPAPPSVRDFLFDAAAERGYMLDPSSTDGVNVYVYDGRGNGGFIGRTSLGNTAAEGNGTEVALDPQTGRLYGLNVSGLTVIDGRRTPVGSGTALAQFAGTARWGSEPVLPPDAHHPYPRFIGQYQDSAGYLRSFTFFADRYAVSQDPPAAKADENTYQGAIPPGASTSESHDGSARAYGLHDVFVGSYGGAVDAQTNSSAGDGYPFSGGNPDLFLGVVDRLSIRNGTAGARAAAAEGDSTTEYKAGQCMDASHVVGSCVNYPSGVQAPPCPLGSPTPNPSQDPMVSLSQCQPPSTAQSWPFMPAECSAPGAGATDATSDGVTTTVPPYSPAGAGAQQQGGDSFAHATVNCTATAPRAGTVTGTAYLRAIGGGLIPGASLTVSEASASTSVVPPDAGGQVTSASTAAVRGIHIDIPGANVTLDIGYVTQSATTKAGGRPGSATASGDRTVTIGSIALNGQRLCGGSGAGNESCNDPQSAIDQINQQFPTFLHIFGPAELQPDDRYLHGSPGGYTAAVQASPALQQGDQQFNEMRAPGEATFLPALRIVLYNDSHQLSREVIDFAGVEADSELGLSVLQPDQLDTLTNIVDQAQAEYLAGVSSGAGGGSGGGSNSGGGSTGDNSQGGGPSGPLAVAQRVFAGLDWLVRTPRAAIQMLGALWLLFLPMVLMRRRWS